MNTTGLSDKEVLESRKKYGSNSITKITPPTIFQLFIESLGDPIIKILLIALAIKIIFLIKSFDIFETIGIFIAVFVSSLISTISEYGSQKVFIRMQEEAAITNVKVKRNNKVIQIPYEEIVVNDLVILEQGDKIPADGIIIDGNISTDESSLTGETKEQEKNANEKNNKVYMGTVVTSKKGIMKVTDIGNKTIYGKLNEELNEKAPDSPLKIRLNKLAIIISRIGYIGAFFVSFSYLFSKIVLDNNFNLELIMDTITNFPLMMNYLIYTLTLIVTIIVVAVPEGLPMMITLVLSKNMKKMIKENVLVRKMTGIETAGNINILFTDKTGTLTKGNLEVSEIALGNMKKYLTSIDLKKEQKIYKIIKYSILYNTDCTYTNNKIIGGNSTDKALYSFFIKDNIIIDNIKIIKKKHFNSTDKYSATLIDYNGKISLFKGAKEVILPKCNSYINEYGEKKILNNKNEINDYINKKSRLGIRVICIAIGNNTIDDINNLTLVGIVSIKDEIRDTTKEGIKLINDAGIKVIMITGDNKETAIAIGKEINLLKNNDIVLTSDEFNSKNEEEIINIFPKLAILSRALPSDKTKLIKIAQKMNNVVGMTGDGINDAPSLKNSDVGFSMGSGTEVAKEASDIIILDNNIKSIYNAILYGRTIFKNIRKFIICQLTINFCAIGLSFIGTFIGIDTPVTVIQMLWINMVMDTLTGLAFAYEPPLKEYMKVPPKNKNEPIINKYMLSEIIITGLYSLLLCIFFLKSKFVTNYYKNNKKLMSAFFGLFIFIDVFNSLNARTERINIFSKIFNNKFFILILNTIIIIQLLLIYYGGNMFRTIGLSFNELEFMIILASTVIPIDIIRKIYLKKKKRKREL